MRLALALTAALCLALGIGSAEKKKNKPPDIEILESKAARGSGVITIDGKVKNSGEKTIHNLALLFNFKAPEGGVVTTQRGGVDDEELKPGQESVFHVELQDPVRAVEYTLNAQDGGGRDLRIANAGPRPIE